MVRIGVVLAAVLFAPSSFAQQDGRAGGTASSPAARVGIDGGADVMMIFGTECARSSDTAMCMDAGLRAGFHLSPFFYLSPRWSVGIRGAVDFGGTNSHGSSVMFWQAEAEGRYHLVVGKHGDAWFGADAGVLAISQHVPNDGMDAAASFTTIRPIFGLGAGIAFPLADAVRLGPELRGFFVPGSDTQGVIPRGTSFADQVGVLVGVTGTMLFGG